MESNPCRWGDPLSTLSPEPNTLPRTGSYADVARAASEAGFEHMAPLDPVSLEPREDVRALCEVNTCGKYGTNWACPPACGDLDALAGQMASYREGILVQTTGTLARKFDYRGMLELGKLHNKRMRTLVRALRPRFPDLMPMGAGACEICPECTYPDRPCKIPELAFVSMEAAGLVVSRVCKANGLPYYYGPGTLTYVGAVLFG